MRRIYPFLALFLGLIILGGCSANKPANNSQNEPKIDEATLTLNEAAPLTLTEIAKHASVDNCWMLINGQVYDLSSYTKAGNHPGGDKILNGCGKDATTMFQMIGKHSNKATDMLPQYLLGALK